MYRSLSRKLRIKLFVVHATNYQLKNYIFKKIFLKISIKIKLSQNYAFKIIQRHSISCVSLNAHLTFTTYSKTG